MEERASVILPTVTCSSCSAPIPLSSLTEHVCRPGPGPNQRGPQMPPQASRAQPRQPPKLAQITIPPVEHRVAGPSSSFRGPGSFPAEPSPSFKRPFANSPASSGSPASLNIPLHNPSPASLRAPSPAFGAPSPRTPSPTNPFFPHNSPTPEKAVIVHGLGLGVGKAQGPFPTDAPLPPGVQDPMAAAGPDMTSGGNAGMAGVGRRAFAAAAWGVRAGVALAAGAQQGREPTMPSAPQLPAQAFPSAHPHRGPSPQPGPPAHRGPTPVPVHSGPSNPGPQRGPSPQPPHQRVLSPTLSEEGSAYYARPPIIGGGAPRSASPTVREPPVLPRAPLANRPRGQTVSNGSQAQSPTDQPPMPIPMIRKESASSHSHRQNSFDSNASSHLTGSPGGDSIAQLIKARQASGDQPKSANKAFHDRYKALVASSSGSSTPSGTASPLLGFGGSLSRRNSEEDKVIVTTSPEQASVGLPEGDDDDSALPWARPGLADSPDIKQLPALSHTQPSAPPSQLRRHRPAQSEGSSNSSNSRGGHSEQVVTPSGSWEGIADPHDASRGLGMSTLNDRLEQIEEDEDGERVVFGIEKQMGNTKRDRAPPLKPSMSSSTLASAAMYDPTHHTRANTAPDSTRRGSSSTTHTSGTSRRTKTCVKCNEVVGGSKRFVERDGVVLCEKDWKKLYLPSCRRCQLPIEKSAVSSSDGQLKGKWHRECFTCTKCDRPFEGDSFYVLGGKPWCQYHYHEEK